MLRVLELDTSHKHLGINIEEKQGTGIFVTSVNQTSLASEVGIEIGDQIIEVTSFHNSCRPPSLHAHGVL